jgi:hypothetical protein
VTSGGRAINSAVPVELLTRKWADVCLKESALNDMLSLMEVNPEESVVWTEFVAVAAGHITQVNFVIVYWCESV